MTNQHQATTPATVNLDIGLIEAAQSGKVDEVKALLAQGASPNALSSVLPVSIVAATAGHWGIARMLVEHGAELQGAMRDADTLLHWAARAGELDFCKFLLQRGSSVNARNTSGCTPLFLACASISPGSTFVAELLLAAGATANTPDKDKFTPLIQAAHDGRADLCELLIRAGAKIEQKEKDGYTALGWAARRGHGVACDALVQAGAALDPVSRHGSTPMIRAAQGGHAGVIELLHRAGASIFWMDVNGQSALHWAASKGFEDAARVLIGLGAPTCNPDDRGRTPLSLAAACGSAPICRLLLDRGANPNALDRDMNTPLHEAARARGAATQGDHALVCRLLINCGAGTERRNCLGYTALHVAAVEGIEQTATALIQGGADPHAKAGNLTAAGLAGRHKRKALAAQIKSLTQSIEAARAVEAVMNAHCRPAPG